MTGDDHDHILTPALDLEDFIKEGLVHGTGDDHNGGSPGQVGCLLVEQLGERMRFGTLEARQEIKDMDELTASLAGGYGLNALVVRMAVDPVCGQTDGLFLGNRPVGQGGRDDDGQFGRIDVAPGCIFAGIQVEEDDGLQGDGRFELLDLQAAGRQPWLSSPHAAGNHWPRSRVCRACAKDLRKSADGGAMYPTESGMAALHW